MVWHGGKFEVVQTMNKWKEPLINLKRGTLIAIIAYLVLAVSFYFLAGDQLRYRDSRGNLAMPAAESGTIELIQGAVVEQTFTVKIHRLETLSVQWGTYYRTNAGTVTMELLEPSSNVPLLRQSFDVATIPEGGWTTLTAEVPVERSNAPLILRLTADSLPGGGISPLCISGGNGLTVNGDVIVGSLCLAAAGTDYIWTGLHYWSFVVIGLCLLILFFVLVAWRMKKGHSYVVNAIIAMQKYRFLIRQLVNRDFKTKYKRSVLGMFWSFLNPLLTMTVQYIVFSTIFRSDIPNYPAYLLIGIVSFNFFNEACSMSLTAVVGNASLITKVYMPKYIYPLTRVMSSVVNFAISLIPMVLVCLFTGIYFKKAAILALFFFACLIAFSLGMGLVLATSMVFFRDTQFLWGVLSMVWMYLTPIFYPETILPDHLRGILEFNPLYWFLRSERMCILNGLSPEPIVYVQCFLMAIAMLIAGALIFRKNQDKFVLYL